MSTMNLNVGALTSHTTCRALLSLLCLLTMPTLGVAEGWHMPDITKAKKVTTTTCGVCGTLPPPPVPPKHATTTPAPYHHIKPDTHEHGPGAHFVQAPSLDENGITTTNEIGQNIPWIAGIAGGSAVALGGIVAGIVVATQKDQKKSPEQDTKPQVSSPVVTPAPVHTSTPVYVSKYSSNRFLARGAHQVPEQAPATATLPLDPPFAGANTPAVRKVEQSKIGEVSHSGLAGDIAQKMEKGGVTMMVIIGCVVLALVFLSVGCGLFLVRGSRGRGRRSSGDTSEYESENEDTASESAGDTSPYPYSVE